TVVDIVERGGDLAQQLARIGAQLGARRGEHRPVLRVDQLYPQALADDVDEELVLELTQRGVGLDDRLELALEVDQARAFTALGDRLRGGLGLALDARGRGVEIDRARAGGIAPAHLADLAREVLATALDDARAVAGAFAALHGELERVLEVVGDALEVA